MEIYSNRVVDLFAGPGGWSLACKRLGLDEIGIEFEKNAVATREANGFNPGAQRVRMALVAETAECREAAERIVQFIQSRT